MRKELTIKQEDFWRLINREQFLLKYFQVRLRYRIRTYRFSTTKKTKKKKTFHLAATNNQCIYVEVISDDKTIGEHAEVNLTKKKAIN